MKILSILFLLFIVFGAAAVDCAEAGAQPLALPAPLRPAVLERDVTAVAASVSGNRGTSKQTLAPSLSQQGLPGAVRSFVHHPKCPKTCKKHRKYCRHGCKLSKCKERYKEYYTKRIPIKTRYRQKKLVPVHVKVRVCKKHKYGHGKKCTYTYVIRKKWLYGKYKYRIEYKYKKSYKYKYYKGYKCVTKKYHHKKH